MEAATAAPPAETEEKVEEAIEKESKAAAAESATQLFKFSGYVHLGEGATTGVDGDGEDICACPNQGADCENPEHFHAWVRLPNPYQIRDIHEKASAAKARKIRLVKDPDTDAHAVLEYELDLLAESDDKEGIVEEIVDRDFRVDMFEALREVESGELEDLQEDDEPKYKNIDQDREEFERMGLLTDEERDEEAFTHLRDHLAQHAQDVKDALERQQKPRREVLMERPMPDLIDMIRKDRIENVGTEQFMHVYSTWQMFAGTMRTKKSPRGRHEERMYKDINQLMAEDEEIVYALKDAFGVLESKLAKGRAAKNS